MAEVEKGEQQEQKSKKKSVGKNYFYNLTYQLFLIIIPLVVTPYVARVLGADGSGQYSYTFSLCTYFTLAAALGFGYYAQRKIAQNSGDAEKQSLVFWEIVIARLIPVAVTLIVYFALIFAKVYGERYDSLMWILTINVVAVAFDISFFFQGNEEFGKIVIRNVLIKTAGIVCIFVFVKHESDLWLYALIQSLSVILSNASLWLYLPKILKKVPIKEIKPMRHLLPTFILFLPTIATSVYTTLDKTLIGLITKDDAENGNYEYAEKLIKMALTVITSLGAVLIPRNSKKFAEGDIEGVRENIDKTVRFVFFIGVPLMLGMIVVSDNFIPWYLGDGYPKAADLMKILSPIIVIIGLSNVFGLQYLIPSGQDKKFTIAIVVGAVVNFALNILLIYFLKSYGAAIATVIAETVVTVIMLIFIRKNIGFKRALLSSWKYFLSGAIMFTVCFFVGRVLSPSVLNTFIIVITGVGVYTVLVLVLRDKFVFDFLKKIKNKFTKEKNNEAIDNMEEMTLREIQLAELDILIEFDKICKENNLKYSVSSGTLLGAIRHNGFIPWDDDIDVEMPRPDYEKLISLIENKEITLKDGYELTKDRGKDAKYPWIKLLNTSYKTESFIVNDGNSGLFIDIFPLDGFNVDIKKALKTHKKIQKLKRLLAYNYLTLNNFSGRKKLLRKLYSIHAKCYAPEKLVAKINKLSLSCPYENSDYVGCLNFKSTEIIGAFTREDIEDTTDLDFEGYKFKAYKCYDKYLTAIYGDYMTLPKEPERAGHTLKCTKIQSEQQKEN